MNLIEKGDYEEAFDWILAGHRYDRLARETLLKHASWILEFILQQYGGQVPGK